MNYGVMIMPEVVINADVKLVDKVPDEKEAKRWINEQKTIHFLNILRNTKNSIENDVALDVIENI